jgi:hypothetical protein
MLEEAHMVRRLHESGFRIFTLHIDERCSTGTVRVCGTGRWHRGDEGWYVEDFQSEFVSNREERS